MTDPKSNKQPIYNFGAGPACLPVDVLEQIRDDIPDWYEGMSIMEISHRLPVFMELTQSIEQDLRSLLTIPDEFAVLFMHGGARTQFSAVPLNLLNGSKVADYLVTGHWSDLAYQDAQRYCQPHLVASSKEEHYTKIPEEKEWNFSKQGAYLHYTDNETIHGVEFPHPPKVKDKWLISDMTSNILTKPIDFSSYGLIYASAQKNLGIAGITVVIVRKELLGKEHPFTPPTMSYAFCEKTQSMGNTSPVFCWYVLGLVLKWVKKQGNCETLANACKQKSTLIYDVIDNSNNFYISPVVKEYRSRVNVPFRLPSAELETLFLNEANAIGLKQLKGHKTVGGCRASLYNAMPLEGVEKLAEFMKEFEKTRG
ncbi:MAG: phosphoserine transaminase [Gammaproteobacteria bacterium 39-13]|nr:phosphoserine transaminase [Gammaproteobacteria bacterium]OJV94303.1 MAG: phosphoserine transaminase [Gammaproteobacteria bacterium 39-13]